jgi:DNA-binding transcriptional regulator/RsmH inhibitor MraZ
MDKEGRVPLPKSVREDLGKTVVIAPDPANDIFLNVFRVDEFEEWVDSLLADDGGYDEDNIDHHDMDVYFSENSATLDVDSANRIAIPEQFQELAKLGRELYIFGRRGKVVVCDKELRDAQRAESGFDPSRIMKKKTRTDPPVPQ